MTLLSRKADYALLILSYLCDKQVGGNARAIAKQFGLSPSFVANILKELCQKGFVVSHRGVKGGYTLARPAGQVTLAELLETVEDGFRLTSCNPGSHPPSDVCSLSATCTVKGPIGEVHRRLMEVLRAVTLAELFDPVSPAPPARFSALPMLDDAAGCPPRTTADETTPA